MRDKINKARDKRDMNRLRPYRSLLKEWVLPVSDGIAKWVEERGAKRGPKPISLKHIRGLSSDTLALVTLKSVLRQLGLQRRKVMSIAFEIGSSAEHEARAAAWEAQEPDDWKAMEAHYARRGSDAVHRKRSRVVLFNRFVRDRIEWTDWGDEVRIRVGLDLLDIACSVTKRFHIIGDPDWLPRKGKQAKHRPLVVEPDQELLEWLSRSMDDELLFWPVLMPTIIPPKPWAGARSGDGGYWTPFVKAPYLIRFKAMTQQQRQRAIDEFDAVWMPEVYSALNVMQNTAWRVNTKVLDVVRVAWERDLAIGGLPRKEAEFVPPRPEEAEDDKEVYKAWARMAAPIRTRNATRFSHFVAANRCIVAAERFKDEPEIYFPYMLDFRGRMYPIPTDLQPQGDDLHRGLLTFAKGKPVAAEDAGWLAVNLANCYGVDKVSFDDRMAWVEEKNTQWRSIADDPLGDMRWLDADDPWQALAAVFEWVRWLDEGEGMISALPIKVDGTCNGIQHLSAMVRDHVGGEAVNLVPGDAPRDIYQDVADKLTNKLKELEGVEELAAKWLYVFDGRAPRSVTKRPVMILPYGGTRHAYFSYTMDWLKENDPTGTLLPEPERAKAVTFLVKHLWEAVSDSVVSARKVMEWIKKCAGIAGETGLPLYWRTPCGFMVRHFYGEVYSKQIETKIDGQRLQLRLDTTTDKLNKMEQLQGIAPNFVHSMDSSALVTSVNIAAEQGIESMTTIHDAYGTVAADMWTLAGCLRRGFVMTYNEPVLEQFLQACKDVNREATKWPPLPQFGELELEDVIESDYFFA